MNHVRNSTLLVHVKRYNLTKINFSYLNSTFSQLYNILKIEFSRYIQELKRLMIISNIIITIPCNAYNQTINYRIQSEKITSTKVVACQVSQPTKLIMSATVKRTIHSLKTSEVSRKMEITTFNNKSLKTDRNIQLPTTMAKENLPTLTASSILGTTTTETTPMLTIKFSLRTTAAVLARAAITVTFIASTTLSVLIKTTSKTITTAILLMTLSTTIVTNANKTINEVKDIAMTTTMIVLDTNTNLTTSLASQSSSSLLYLLSVFFIITICVIIASIWGFFRQNTIDNQHDIGDEHLTTMHNMMNTDKYAVTDKDSKSVASWSHGSTLLLSPLVK